MELIVISSPVAVENEAWLINNLFAEGLSIFHLRKPSYNMKQMKELLNGIDKQYHMQIALHQHHNIASEFGIKRLHYTEQTRSETGMEKLRLQKEQGFILTTSAHDVSLLPSLKQFDYVFYGPVFDSISKQGYKSKVAADFNLAMYSGRPKVIALGGVEVNNLNKIKEMNFDGAAVLGTIWNEPDKAMDNFRQLRKAV